MNNRREQLRRALLLNVINHGMFAMNVLNDAMLRVMRRRRIRATWSKNIWLRRELYGFSETLLEECLVEEPEQYKILLGVDVPTFEFVLERIAHRIQRQDTNMRTSLSPKLRLQVTLSYLRTGMSYDRVAAEFRIHKSTVSNVIIDTCEAIIDELSPDFLSCPDSPEEWVAESLAWEQDTAVPHMLGAIDGTHIRMSKPANSGKLYRNYKGYFSIVLLAVVNANYKAIWVDVGATGCSSDSQIFNHSELLQKINDGTINFPQPECLPDEDYPLPYYFVGDDAFSLKTWMMKPHSKPNLEDEERVFNYRISRGRIRVGHFYDIA